MLICSSISCSIAMVSVIILDSSAIFSISTLLALVGIQLHYVILSPYIATYTNSQNKIRWYTKAYYMGYVGYFLTTLLGGAITVKMFSLRAGETYAKAKILTKYISDMTPTIKSAYLQGNKDVLLVTAIISILAVIPVILIREEKADYCLKENKVSFIEQIRDIFRAITGRYPIIYIIYWALVSFGMGLFSSYYTVFLNRNLHIDKVTSSQLVSLSYIAIVVFMLFTPIVVKKCGQIVTLGGVALLSVPFMLIIANGDKFGSYTVPVVGISLFIRAGLMNLSSPVDSSLSMELVPDKYRPAYASALNFVAGLSSIASGIFTGKFLFITQEGYRTAYYIAALIYVIACVILLLGLWKYNRNTGKEGDINNV